MEYNNYSSNDNRYTELDRKFTTHINRIYKAIGIETIDDIERLARKEWEDRMGYDKETLTTKGMRRGAVDGICMNMDGDFVYVGDIIDDK